MTENNFELDADVYIVQRRPATPQLIINDDYQGIRILDIWTQDTIARIPFPDGYASSGRISSWCLRADGQAMVVFNDEQTCGCYLSLRDHASQAFPHPPWPITMGMPYDWRGDLWMKDPDSFRFGMTRDGSMQLTEVEGDQVLRESRAWRAAVVRMWGAGGGCLRVEPDLAQMLFVVVEESKTNAGIIGWADQERHEVTIPGSAHRLAAHGLQLIALEEYEARVIDASGRVALRIPADDGFHFAEVETISDMRGNGFVVLVSATLDGRILTRFTVKAV